MNRCDSCKYWVKFQDSDYRLKNLGNCYAIPVYDSVVTINSPVVLAKGFEDTTAFAADADGYWAGLKTLGNFGCTMHKELVDEI